jgi:hypothetical protein
METPETTGNVFPQGWADVLDQVQAALTSAEAAAAEREARSPPVSSAAKSVSQSASWQLCLERLKKRLDGLNACLLKAQEETAGLETVLTDGGAAIDKWLRECRPVAQRLAKGPAHAVG